jgi:2-polyprenyl-3-methyl-5-hydroxy-6-metoxy-1,4-benzoquinol methylase
MFEKFIAAGVEPFATGGIRVLDYGCGPGPVLAGLLRQKGHAVATYDLFFQSDEAYRDKTYDVITMTEVLEHLPDPLATLRGLLPRLAPGGILAVMTLFHPNDWEKFSKWWYRKDPTHVSFFTETTLKKMAERLGLISIFCDGKKTMVFRKKTVPTPG